MIYDNGIDDDESTGIFWATVRFSTPLLWTLCSCSICGIIDTYAMNYRPYYIDSPGIVGGFDLPLCGVSAANCGVRY